MYLGTSMAALRLTTAFVLALSVCPAAGWADREIRLKRSVNPETIRDIYRGNTWTWGRGGAYWGLHGNVVAATDEGLADGVWYVTDDASLCFWADWMSPGAEGAVTTPVKTCWQHARAENGQIWQFDPKDERWYRLDQSQIVEGNRVMRLYRRKQAEMGLPRVGS